jgi:uncharacterized protein (DUF362 family)
MHSNRFTRRSFLGGTIGLCVGAAFLPRVSGLNAEQEQAPLGCRQRFPNPWVENGKPVVAVVRGTEFAAMLAKGLELLGGFARFGAGKPVMIKPNFILPEAYPTTTDGPSILAAVEALSREGFNDIIVADGGHRRSKKTEAVDFYALEEKAQAGGFKNAHLLEDEFFAVKDARWSAMQTINVSKTAYEMPLMINMPVIKQHQTTIYTCVFKNLMGPIDVPSRMYLHTGPQGMDPAKRLDHAKLCVAEIAHAVNPDITIIDARQVMGKNAYRPGGGVIVDANRVIVSGDSLAAEIAAADILQECYPDFQVTTIEDSLKHAAALGLGAASLEDVVLKEASA